MTSKPNPQNASNPTAPDYSAYKWTNGHFEGNAVAVVKRPDGRIYLGLRGHTRKSREPTYVSAQFTPTALAQVIADLTAALAQTKAALA
jgi:hypothetical protein